MVEKIIVIPADVRGAGNIVKTKLVTDFKTYDCELSLASDSSCPAGSAFTTSADYAKVLLEATVVNTAGGKTITFTATVLNSSGAPATNVTVNVYAIG